MIQYLLPPLVFIAAFGMILLLVERSRLDEGMMRLMMVMMAITRQRTALCIQRWVGGNLVLPAKYPVDE